jgi:predicted CXXCH cytochrome family protein
MLIIDTMHSFRRGSWLSVLLVTAFAVGACKGDTGEPGPEGPPGEPGEPGQPPDIGIEPAPFGLVGRVMEPNMLPVPGGTVYLVPASDVEELSQTEIDIFASSEDTAALTIDEPIEDLLDTNEAGGAGGTGGAGYEQAAVDESGVYRFETLPEGSYFVVWTPADDDTEHLPGGDSSNVSFDTASLVGMQMDIRVSSQPSSSATYVGSSTCMVCHGLHSTTRTAHNVGLQVPGVRSILQDIEPWPDFDEGLDAFETGTTTLYYFNCDDSPSTPEDLSNCEVDVQDPGSGGSGGSGARFEINLRQDSNGAYYVEMVKGTTTVRYDVVLTYGGALGKQQYLMRRLTAGDGWSYFLLPLQYNYEGDATNDSSDDWPWRDYRSDQWFDFGAGGTGGAGPLTEPPNEESFDNNCAGCHFSGYRLQGSDVDGWSARAVVDAGGAFDYDGDGRVELINTGCEACHGPGSEHLMPSPNGSHIVSPGLLTPGRQAALCGSCHSRPLGKGAGETGLPLSLTNEMPPPGIRRAEFALNHTSLRVSGPPAAFFNADDPKSADARANYQQYSDHIRSRHYRNPVRLTSCTGCHSPHANLVDIAAMDTSGNDNALCTTCHSPAANPELYPLTDHVEDVTERTDHDGFADTMLCTECHMVPTAKSGAAIKQLSSPIQYYWNDVASHRMIMTRWRDVTVTPDRPVAFTNECGFCHSGFLSPP